jgi:hypothetical protein
LGILAEDLKSAKKLDLSDEMKKKLRFKTIERFGGEKGDLSRAVKIWVAKEYGRRKLR